MHQINVPLRGCYWSSWQILCQALGRISDARCPSINVLDEFTSKLPDFWRSLACPISTFPCCVFHLLIISAIIFLRWLLLTGIRRGAHHHAEKKVHVIPMDLIYCRLPTRFLHKIPLVESWTFLDQAPSVDSSGINSYADERNVRNLRILKKWHDWNDFFDYSEK